MVSSRKYYGFLQAIQMDGWEKDIENMDGFNNGVLIYPLLWAKECNIETASKKISPLSEIIKIYFGFKKEFNL